MSLFVGIIKKRKNTTAPWKVRAIQSVIKQNFMDSPIATANPQRIRTDRDARGSIPCQQMCTDVYLLARYLYRHGW